VPATAEPDPKGNSNDPYEFCFSDLRPVVIGAGPDEAAADAGVPPDAGDAGL
jgi:hypothetical protein